jgi:hypothetical protein
VACGQRDASLLRYSRLSRPEPLQIQRSGFDFRRYKIFLEAEGLERGPLSLVSTTEELLGRKCSDVGLENRDYGRRRSAALTTRHLSIPQKLSLTSPTSGRRSVGVIRPRTQVTEFFLFCFVGDRRGFCKLITLYITRLKGRQKLVLSCSLTL